MKTNLSLKVLIVSSCCLLLAGFATARPVPSWPYEKLTAEADLIVIATPTAVRETEERTTLMATMPTIGVETTFGISSILKGQADTKTIVLHHLRLHLNDGEIPIPDGPGLVSFDPKEKKSFLLFLKREADGRYASLTGQIDPVFGVKLLEYPPFAVVEKRNSTARLQFRLLADDKRSNAETLPTLGGEKRSVSREVLLDETSVSGAGVAEMIKSLYMYIITVRFTEAGGKMFVEITRANVGRRLALVLDGEVLAEQPITEATSDFQVNTKGYGPEKAAALGKAMTEAVKAAAAKDKPNAQLWPPPLDEKRLIGTWVRKDAPRQGVENHTLLVLREDHSWYEAEISGPLTEPVRFKKFATTSKWEVVNVGEKNTQTILLFKQKEGGSNVWNILKVGAEELDTSGFGPTIIDLRHYTRCEAQTAAKLNERLNQKETEPTAK